MVQTLDFGEGSLQTVLYPLCEWRLSARTRWGHTHCASYCFRPVAIVMLSSKTPSSSHKESFFKEGRPAKSFESLNKVEPVESDNRMTYIEDRSDKSLLLLIKGHTRGGLDVGILDTKIGSCC